MHRGCRVLSGDIDDFRGLLAKVGNGGSLSIDEAERAFDIMTSGDATPAQMGAFLMGLKVRGETADELAGGARVLRADATTGLAQEATAGRKYDLVLADPPYAMTDYDALARYLPRVLGEDGLLVLEPAARRAVKSQITESTANASTQ